MNFLNIGPWELMVILAIAILLVGPKRVVEVARTIGRVTSQMRKLSGEFMGTIQAELQEAEQETRQALESVGESGAIISAEIQGTEQETRQTLESVGENEQQVTTSIKGELQAVERETHQLLEEIGGNFAGIIKGEQGAKKEQDEEKAGRE